MAILAALTVCASASATTPGTASASSIVFTKNGNVWLSSPDGSRQYQLTSAGGYSEPSQANDGTIVAVRDGQFVRMDREGRLLNAPVDWFGNRPPPPGSNADNFLGPYHARVSPDGTKIAYSFTQREYTCDPITTVCSYQTVEYTTTSAVNSYTQPSPATSVSRDDDPSWIDNTRVLVTDPFDPQQINTWVAGRGDDGEQWWFDGARDQNGFGYLERDGALSPDGSKFVDTAAVGGQFSAYDHLFFYTTNGPAWNGAPPYDNNNPNAPTPNPPMLSCDAPIGAVWSPTWSPNSAQVAFAQADGIHVATVPADISQPQNCAGITGHLVLPGASDPVWGPADLGTPPAPQPQPRPLRQPRPRRCATSRHGTHGCHKTPHHPHRRRHHHRRQHG